MTDDNKLTLSMDKKSMAIAGIVLLVCAILVGGYFWGKGYLETQKEQSVAAGYTQALYDVAVAISQQGTVSYIVPSTNVTVTLGFVTQNAQTTG